jgi:uncharacterized membrane protein YcaP (DUF421 family)
MDSIARGFAVYFFLLVLFRVAGKRSLGQITTFDAVLLLIISEAVQQALINNDTSMTNAFILVLTLLGLDVSISLLTLRSPALDRLINDRPLVLLENGKLLKNRMRKARVTEDDILAMARELQGLERLDQIKFAVLERSGGITVVPNEAAR